MKRVGLAALLGIGLALAPSPARAFALFTPTTRRCPTCPGGRELLLDATLRSGQRWDAGPFGALRDGLQVGVAAGLAASIGVTDPELSVRIDEAIVAAIEAWSTPELQFDVTLGASGPGFEIFIAAVEGTGNIGGLTDNTIQTYPGRYLTNGQQLAGNIITHSEIRLEAATLTSMFSLIGPSFALNALRRLVSHEVGHALGLGHPTDPCCNLDQDSDPFNAMIIAPLDPFAGLRASPEVDYTAIMIPFGSLPGLSVAFDPVLRPDDLAGRDVLYPGLPEPSGGALLAAAAVLALAARAMRQW